MTDERELVGDEAGPAPAGKAIAVFAVVVVVVGAVFGVWLARRSGTGTDADRGHLSVALTDFDGGRFTLASYRGRPIVVNFWASWCPSCAAEMPAFEHVYRRFRGSVEFVGVNHSDSRSSAEELARSTGVTYRLAEDPQGRLFTALGGAGMPTTAFIGADGRVAEVLAGQLTAEQLTSLIQEHLEVSS